MSALPITAGQVQEHYDSLVFIYRTFWGDHIHHGLFLTGKESPADAQVQLLDYCIRLLEIPRGAEVLDVGCGHGGTLLRLAQSLSCSGTGLTISPKQAKLARERAAREGLADLVNIQVGNADFFEFPAATFDLVWTMESSEHFSDKAGYFSKVEKTLRPGGKLLLAAWTGSMDRPLVREVARAFLCPELWSGEQYQSAIEGAGMRVKHCENLGDKVAHTWEICRQQARFAAPAVKLLPRSAREFVEGIDTILDAYRSGDLTYTVLVAEKLVAEK